MTDPERVLVVALLVTFVAVYGSAAKIAVSALRRRLRGQAAPRRSAVRRWARRGVLALAAIGVGCMAYAYFVEPYWLEVTHVEIRSAKLPPGSDPVRIVHFSDTHCDPKVRLEESLPSTIAELKPDVIVFTGDAINSRGGLGNFRRCMRRLAEIAPTYAVRGNWDVDYFGGVDLYGGTGVVELADREKAIDVKGLPLRLAGAPVGHRWRAFEALPLAPDGPFTVLLYHYPGAIEEVSAGGAVDLQLSGHIHGGQIALPWYGAIITLARFGKRYEWGLYRVRGTWLYVNRGIGMEGGHVPRMRFFARPEVTVIDVRPDR